jgi:hypothetical protein
MVHLVKPGNLWSISWNLVIYGPSMSFCLLPLKHLSSNLCCSKSVGHLKHLSVNSLTNCWTIWSYSISIETNRAFETDTSNLWCSKSVIRLSVSTLSRQCCFSPPQSLMLETLMSSAPLCASLNDGHLRRPVDYGFHLPSLMIGVTYSEPWQTGLQTIQICRQQRLPH